jgi:microcompartment protein CcmK/EutM
LVLVLDEGNSSRQIFGVDTGPIRATVVGIVDDADFGRFSIQGP